MKIAVQCDFDGTVTEEDVSFLLLEHFAEGDWRAILRDYQAGRIPVGAFNTQAFAMVKADKQTLVDFVLKNEEVRVRPGFTELVGYCSGRGIKFVIVSNGVDFYIEAILVAMGIKGIEVFAAKSRFKSGGMGVAYIGRDGQRLEAGFKEAHVGRLREAGYDVIYVGNGMSDIYPARLSRHVFATGDLLERCRGEKLVCLPFNDFRDVLNGLKALLPG
jgi:2-hydroxy-3-keto-5-methylthiopentenyl-1-phosphate phosphatase